MQNTALVLSTATTTTTPRQLTTGPVQVIKPKPTISLLRAACDSFHVKGTARLLAYELLSYWSPNGTVFPSVATLADGLGLQRRVVHRHLVHLERVGLWVRKARPGRASIYELRLPGPTHSSAYPPTHSSAYISNHREVTKKNVQRLRCAVCGNSWPETYGDDCYQCLKARNGPKPRGGLPTYTERPVRESAPMTAQQTADAEERAIADGYRKVGGQWRKR